jgi:hypothetical protein
MHSLSKHISNLFLAFALIALIASAGCKPAASAASSGVQTTEANASAPDASSVKAPEPLKFSGSGDQRLEIAWHTPGILHITAAAGSSPVKATLTNGADQVTLVDSSGADSARSADGARNADSTRSADGTQSTGGAVDEYRGYLFPASGATALQISADRAWSVTVLPPDSAYFPKITIPGTYQGSGSAVVLLEGKHGIAIFDSDHAQNFTAWAYGPGVGAKLYINPPGDYKGRSVLPKAAAWMVVSAKGPWSVQVLAPCCEIEK